MSTNGGDVPTPARSGAGGRATGEARTYQELGREVLMVLEEAYGGPYKDDGIDQRFAIADTEVTIDVAVGARHSGEPLAIAECKAAGIASTGEPKATAQEVVLALAMKAMLIEREVGVEVHPYLISTKGGQEGALRIAKYLGITVIECQPGQDAGALVFATQEFSATVAARRKVARSYRATIADTVGVTDSLRVELFEGRQQ